MVSADATPQRCAELLDLGAIGFITKPFDVSRVLHVIGNLGREPAMIDRDTDDRSQLAALSEPETLGPLEPARTLELRELCGTHVAAGEPR